MVNNKFKKENFQNEKKNKKDSSKKNLLKKEKEEKPKWYEDLKQETKHSILAIISFTLSLLFILTAFNKAGAVGKYLFEAFDFIFGAGYFLIPILFLFLGVSFLISFRTRILAVNLIGGIFFLTGSLGLIEVFFGNKNGGYFGYLISFTLVKLFDTWVTVLFLTALLIVSILMIFNISLRRIKKEENIGAENLETPQKITSYNDVSSDKPEYQNPEKQFEKENKKVESDAKDVSEGFTLFKNRKKNYADSNLPPANLLQGDKGKPSFGDIKANSNIIKRTLQNFGIEVEMGEVSIGPSVTQFTLKPAQGIKLSKITTLNNDLSLALAVHPLRIEAPIPGKSLIGIEVPNTATALVGLRSLIEASDFQDGKNSLLLALGRNVAGQSVYADLAKMPHLLIAGSTGSGKSVCIHALITSLLYKSTAKNLRFLMIDPKRVELNVYSAIPHLLSPAITEAKKAILALRWATKEMERRYEVLFNAKVRDINSYRDLMAKKNEEHEMPYIVIVIDELADIMAVYPRELEASIVRLAQMSRAVGIHLIVSTQRPSVEVITGLIKANITSRIAFQVASQIDSRTILDMAGAEKLLGNGDMLYLSGDSSKPRRIQGAFVSEDEVKKVSSYLENETPPTLSEDFDLPNNESGENGKKGEIGNIFNMSIIEENENEEDELYNEAKNIVIEAKKASASYLQRRLKIGYSRAARLLDIMEKNGVVGPVDGAKPREIYVSRETNYE